MSKNLLPAQSAALPTIAIKYIAGFPYGLRVDMKTAQWKRDADPITKKGETVTFKPLAIRIFTAQLFNYVEKKWAEFYFVNCAGALASFRVHGYSVDALQTALTRAFYEGIDIANCEISLVFEAKSGKNGAFFVGRFEISVLNESELKAWQSLDFPNAGDIFDSETTDKGANLYLFNYKGEITTL